MIDSYEHRSCEAKVVKEIETNPCVKLMLIALAKSGCPVQLTRHVSCEPCHGRMRGDLRACVDICAFAFDCAVLSIVIVFVCVRVRQRSSKCSKCSCSAQIGFVVTYVMFLFTTKFISS